MRGACPPRGSGSSPAPPPLRVPLAFLLGGFLLLAPRAGAAQSDGWNTTEWMVVCGDASEAALPEASCQDDRAGGSASAARTFLEEASVWLEGLGFREAHPKPISGPHLATISDRKVENALGFYDGERLYLSSQFDVAMGTTENELARQTSELGTPVHELFHAVQDGYGGAVHARVPLWIVEGTANAVMYAWFRKHHPGASRQIRHRIYDAPLHEPPSENAAYDTHYFWSELGDLLGSRADVAYLDEVLSQDDLVSGSGVPGVHRALEKWNREGLYDLYPAFIARSADEERYFDDVSVSEMRLRDGEGVGTDQVPALAANAHRLILHVPPEKTAGLRVELRAGESAGPDAGKRLHLIVDDRRMDRGALDSPERNVFQRSLVGRSDPYELFIRVANVGPEPGDFAEVPYELEITLDEVDACQAGVMATAVNRRKTVSNLLPKNRFLDQWSFSKHRPGVSRLRLSGVVSDGGTACAGHVSALTARGAASVGQISEEDAGDRRAERVKEMTDEAEEMSEDPDAGEAVATARKMLEAYRGSDEDVRRDVVLRIFSPHTLLWRGGGLGDPFDSRHRGIGGWHSNSAVAFTVRLPDTTPDDLAVDSTYRAVAYAPGGGTPERKELESRGGFYTRWEGRFRPIPYPPPHNEAAAERQRKEKKRCRQVKAQAREMAERLRAQPGTGEMIRADEAFRWDDCDLVGHAFGGTVWHVRSGLLTGEVTVESISGSMVTGRIRLSGDVTLRRERTEIYREEGRVAGSRTVDEEERTSSLSVEGVFRAPNDSEGWQQMQLYRSVIVGGGAGPD